MKTIRKYDWTSYIVFTCYVLAALVVIWILASWANVIAHNETDQVYWTFNFFNMFCRR